VLLRLLNEAQHNDGAAQLVKGGAKAGKHPGRPDLICLDQAKQVTRGQGGQKCAPAGGVGGKGARGFVGIGVCGRIVGAGIGAVPAAVFGVGHGAWLLWTGRCRGRGHGQRAQR
jgi:hypothetical protein